MGKQKLIYLYIPIFIFILLSFVLEWCFNCFSDLFTLLYFNIQANLVYVFYIISLRPICNSGLPMVRSMFFYCYFSVCLPVPVTSSSAATRDGVVELHAITAGRRVSSAAYLYTRRRRPRTPSSARRTSDLFVRGVQGGKSMRHTLRSSLRTREEKKNQIVTRVVIQYYNNNNIFQVGIYSISMSVGRAAACARRRVRSARATADGSFAFRPAE